ncbi:hypothetical protein E4U57_002310 [Claviceps arundinis]|uniref:RanBD1 domain-containing protein n=1 Tax=Claviceps arundinis TaxID=1623583 RepID=A0ABQ7P942_9HYPO|nr:hypothetical protein E4U57_002310 [Claviceps arundinis]
MVTFSVPDFDYSTTSSASTPTNRSRSSSPVAKRSNAGPSSPKSSSSRRLGTPHPSSRRAPLTTLDETTPRRFTQSSTGAGSNIFGASVPAKTPFGATFTPRVLQSAMKKPFSAPRIRSTPGPSRVRFGPMPNDTPPRAPSPPPEMAVSRAISTPQALSLDGKPRFTLRIPSPPPELTGEVLTDKIPKTWDRKGSIYADQFLAHLCPPELDEEQRRQYFCILDLRRLKYSADDIFKSKDWTLNILNFAKEFEKSRSLLMLRYGLYEFRKVKPAKEVLKRWRREHGLPDPEDETDDEEEEAIPTPSKSKSKKRKATDDEDSLAPSSKKGKRRATEALVTEPTAFASTPTGKNKRKASGGDDSPSPAKIQKSTPSSSKSLFERVVNQPAAATPAKSATGAESSAFGSSSHSARNIFSSATTSKNFGTPTAGGSTINIFAHTSHASAAKPSDNDEDADSESDSEQDGSQADDAAQGTQETSSAAEGVEQTRAQGSQADADAEEKAKANAEPASPAGSQAKPFQAPAVADQTWNPTKTPIKFAPSASASTSSPFGNVGATPKASASFGSFGASSQGASFVGDGGSARTAADQAVEKHGNQSDMDNDSPSAKKARFETKSPAGQSAFGSNPFASSQPASSASHVFGSSSFSSAPSPEAGPSAASAPPPPSFLFGNKAAETHQAPTGGASYSTTGTSTATSVFGGVGASKPAPDTSTADQTTSFDAKPSTSTASSLFGSGESTPAQQPQPVTAAADAPKLSFGFGSTGTTAAPPATSKPFGAPDSPADSAAAPAAAATPAGMPPFGNSMKQFDFSTSAQSALKSSAIDDAPPKFNFGSGSSTIAASAPATSSFGASSFGSQPTSSFGEETSKPKSTTQHVFGAVSSFGGGESSQPKSPTKPVFGASSSFGSGSTQLTSPTKHTFGASSFGEGSTRPGSSFGEESKKSAASTKHIFGSTTSFGGASSQPAAPTAIFGSTTPFGGASSQPAGSTVNIFGGSSNTAPGSNSLSFDFGKGAPTAAATTTTPSTSFNNPFSFASGGADAAAPAAAPSASSSFSFGGAPAAPSRPVSPFKFGSNVINAPVFGSSAVFSSAPVTGADPVQPPSFSFSSMSEHSAAAEETSSVLGPRPVASVSNLQPLLGGSSTTGTNSSLQLPGGTSFPGGSSLGSTPVAGTPEASAQADSANDGQETGEDGEKEEQVNLVDAADENEEVLHEVRAKVLKFETASDKSDDKDGAAAAKAKSPWAVQGIGQLRLLQNKETKLVRLLLRTEPRGHVALNRALLSNLKYEAQDKYVRLATANEDGTGLETWMIQVKKRELAKELADVMEKNKKCNETA